MYVYTYQIKGITRLYNSSSTGIHKSLEGVTSYLKVSTYNDTSHTFFDTDFRKVGSEF